MSFKTKEEATLRAKAVLRKMKTKGWKIRVHENLGWHFSLQNKTLNLSEHADTDGKHYYSCLISPEPGGVCGLSLWTDPRWAIPLASRNPNTCVDASLGYAFHAVQRLCQSLVPAFTAIGENMPGLG
jgi:hypothetical protein